MLVCSKVHVILRWFTTTRQNVTLAFTASESNYHYVTSAAISSDPPKPNWRKSATKLVDEIIIKCCGV